MKKKEIYEVLDKISRVKNHYVCDSCLRNVRYLIEEELKLKKKKK